MTKFKVPKMSYDALENTRFEMASILNENKIFNGMVIERGNAFEAWASGLEKRFWFQSFMMKCLKRNQSEFLEEYASKSNVFHTLMGFLRLISPENRKEFFRHLFLRYHALNHFSLVAFMWLDAFNLDENNPKYDFAVMSLLLMSYEESVFSSNRNVSSSQDQEEMHFKNVKNSPYDIKDYGYFKNSPEFFHWK